jgi:hypothetical protein
VLRYIIQRVTPYFLDLFSAKSLRTELIATRKVNTRKFIDENRNEKNTSESCKFLLLLLNEEVLAVTFKGLPVAHKPEMKCITNTLHRVASECPHLEKLVYEDPCRYRHDRMELGDVVKILSCTLGFYKLQVLDIFRIECCDVTLGLIAEHLPQLR